MGFQIPKLELPKLPSLDFNSELGKLAETFNPSDMVGQVSGNVTSQQGSIEGMRSQLEGMRSQMQQASSAADFQAMSSYTAGLQQMTDVSCVMSSAKPALTPMTPDALSNPLANAAGGAGGGLMNEAIGAYLGVDPAIVDAVASGDVNTLTSPDTSTDLAIAGAGIYASGMTGGVIPPQMASSVIQSVAGESIHGAVNGTLSGNYNTPPTQLSGSPGVVSGLTTAVASDQTGGLMESAVGQAIPGAIGQVSSNNLASLSGSDIGGIASNLSSSFNPDGYTGTLGGVNFANTESLQLGLNYAGLNRAVELGDIDAASNFSNNLLDAGQPPSLVLDQMDGITEKLPNTPGNVEKYSNVRSDLKNRVKSDSKKSENTHSKNINPTDTNKDIIEESDALVSSMMDRVGKDDDGNALDIEIIINEITLDILKPELLSDDPIVTYDKCDDVIFLNYKEYFIFNEKTNQYEKLSTESDTNNPDKPYVRIGQTIDDDIDVYEKSQELYPYYSDENEIIGYYVHDIENDTWTNVSCQVGKDIVDDHESVARDVIAVVEKDKEAKLYENALDLTDETLESGGPIAEQIYGLDTARKSDALSDIAKSFRV